MPVMPDDRRWDDNPLLRLYGGKPPEPQATYRAAMLPYAEYDDGSYALGTTYPQMVPDTWNAMQKLGRAAQSMFGAEYAPQDVMPTAQDVNLLSALVMTGGIGAGLAGRSARAVSGHPQAQVEASRLLPSNAVGWENAPDWMVRAYATPQEAKGILAQRGVRDNDISPAPTSKAPAQYSLVRHALDDEDPQAFTYTITRDGADTGMVATGRVDGRDAHISWMGDKRFASGEQTVINSADANALGVGTLKQLREAIRADFPQVNRFTGTRVSGSRFGREQSVTMYANAPDAAPAGLLAMTGAGKAIDDPAAIFAQMMARRGSTLPVPSEAGPVTARVYRGAPAPENWPPVYGDLSENVPAAFWSSSDPRIADYYAGTFAAHNPEGWGRPPAPQTIPGEVRFQNPMVVDARGNNWRRVTREGAIEYSTDDLARRAAREGHDGLVVRNVFDDGPLADTYAALKPGTVFSPLTGEQLYTNNNSLAALSVAQSRPEKTKPESLEDFRVWMASELQKMGHARQ